MTLKPHAIIINLSFKSLEPYTVGAFSVIETLRELNFETDYFDNLDININLNNLSDIELIFSKLKDIIKTETSFIGFSAMVDNIDFSLVLAKKIKEFFPDITLGFGGTFFTSSLFKKDVIEKFNFCDFFIRGKSNEIIKEMAEQNFDLSKMTSMTGLNFKKEGQFIFNDEISTFDKYETLSYMPNKSDLNYINTSFSIGCPYRCSFCSQHFHYPNFIRNSVSDCIKELIPHKGKKAYFTDALINSNHNWLKDLCQEMINHKLDIIWQSWFRMSNKLNDYTLLELIYNSGCRSINFGLESASSSVLKHMKKFHNEKVIYEIFDKIRTLNKKGKLITIKLNILIGYPTETEQDFIKTCKFILLNSDIISEVSANPVIIDYELPDFKKLIKNNFVRHNTGHDWSSVHSNPQIRLNRIERFEKVLNDCKIRHQINFKDEIISLCERSGSQIPANF